MIHDEDHGRALIDALARHGEGLPANTLTFAVNEVTQIGLEVIARIRLRCRSRACDTARQATPRLLWPSRSLPASGSRANVLRPSRPMIRLRSGERCERSNRANP